MSINREHLKKHIYASYFNLRIGMAVIGIAMPVLVWLVAKTLEGHTLFPSISAYYHSMSRDVFVGSLFAIGAGAYLYKGYSLKENIALNLAGIFAVGIAIFPTDCPNIPDIVCTEPTYRAIHLFCAVMFFLAIAYVCLFRSGDTLDEIKDDATRKRYRNIYRILGVLMIVLPLLVCAQSYGYTNLNMGQSTIFWIEAVSIWTFAVFWLVKSSEIKKTIFDPESFLG